MKKVYLLSDPITGMPKYIGSTKLKMSHRVRHHLKNAVNNKDKQAWLVALDEKGLAPEVTILEQDCEQYELFEAMYIQLFRSWGFVLFNKTMDGRVGYFRTKEQNEKMSIRLMGKSCNQKTRDAVAKANREIIRCNIEVLNIQSGIFYQSIKEAALAHGIPRKTLARSLQVTSNPYKNILRLDTPEFKRKIA